MEIYIGITLRSNTSCHITDCHAGNPCVHKLDQTTKIKAPMIGKMDGCDWQERVEQGTPRSLYTRECCSIGSLENNILVPKPDSSLCCAKCGTPVDGPYCRGCALLRKEFEEDLLTYLLKMDFSMTLKILAKSSDDNTTFLLMFFKSPIVVNQQEPREQSSQSSSQHYNCCENCGGPHATFQCQPMNEEYYEQSSCYDSNSFGFDQFQLPQYTVNHPIFNAQNEFLDSQNKLMEQITSICDMVGQTMQKKEEERQIVEEQAAKKDMSIEEMRHEQQLVDYKIKDITNDLGYKRFRSEKIDEEYERDCEIRIRKLKKDFNE
ncbi:hypothetical protein Tco_0078030 [Tanacetum coccineum]